MTIGNKVYLVTISLPVVLEDLPTVRVNLSVRQLLFRQPQSGKWQGVPKIIFLYPHIGKRLVTRAHLINLNWIFEGASSPRSGRGRRERLPVGPPRKARRHRSERRLRRRNRSLLRKVLKT